MEPPWSPVVGFISSEPSPTFVASLLGGPLLWGSLSSFQDHCVLTAHRFQPLGLLSYQLLQSEALLIIPAPQPPPPNPLGTRALGGGV